MMLLAWRVSPAVAATVREVIESVGRAPRELAAGVIGVGEPFVADDSGARSREGAVHIEVQPTRLTIRSGLPVQRVLFALRVGDGVLVSSSLALLRACQPLQISVEGLADRMIAEGVPSAPYEGVQVLRGTWTCGDVTSRRDLELDLTPIDDREEAQRALWSALLRAVHPVHSTHDKIALLFSAGLDSSAVLAALLEHVPASRLVLIAWKLHPSWGDTPYLEAWRKRLGTDIVWIEPERCAPLVQGSVVVDATPTSMMIGALERTASRYALEAGASMLFTGVGGDEVFTGSLQAAVREHTGGALGAWRRAARAQLPWYPSVASRIAELLVQPTLRPWLPRSLRVARARRQLASALPAARWAPAAMERAAALQVEAVRAPPRTPEERWYELASRPFWFEMARVRGQWEHAEGLARYDVPLDPELVATIARIAPRHLFEGSMQRGLLRRVLTARAPQIVVARNDKADFEPFLQRMLDATDTGWLRELASCRALRRLGLMRDGLDTRAWSIEAWAQHWPILSSEAFARGVS